MDVDVEVEAVEFCRSLLNTGPSQMDATKMRRQWCVGLAWHWRWCAVCHASLRGVFLLQVLRWKRICWMTCSPFNNNATKSKTEWPSNWTAKRISNFLICSLFIFKCKCLKGAPPVFWAETLYLYHFCLHSFVIILHFILSFVCTPGHVIFFFV